ncbi:MAG: PIN domain-containing protein [Gemmatimonadota bacterium]
MRILFDTNVVLDVLLNRAPHARIAAELLARVERRTLVGLLGSTSITTLHYLLRKARGDAGARTHVRRLLELFEVAAVTRPVLERALDLGFGDFEDAVLHESALLAGADGVVTRDPDGFRRAEVRVYRPNELAAALAAADADAAE